MSFATSPWFVASLLLGSSIQADSIGPRSAELRSAVHMAADQPWHIAALASCECQQLSEDQTLVSDSNPRQLLVETQPPRFCRHRATLVVTKDHEVDERLPRKGAHPTTC